MAHHLKGRLTLEGAVAISAFEQENAGAGAGSFRDCIVMLTGR